MFGLIHRIGIMHEDEYGDPLVFLRLCVPYNETGVFKASKSYMIRAHSERTAKASENKLKMLLTQEHADIIKNGVLPYKQFSGSYLFWEYKQFYAEALSKYVFTLSSPEEAYYFITNTNKKIEYLHRILDRIQPTFRASLAPKRLTL